ncbi:chloride channel protein [Flavobacteriaceae bacterium F89]|uniref:Chloride channel protein n=1 Tax=Cerina litoralis TaxID=2874477 RepID=A0AAE3JMW0_9FLAO|nr:chloride channel protein [Cerina litoralis]MCG2459194.1 chloride channel protein [Cerina litoralis]
MRKSRILFHRFLKWRYRHISNQQFVSIASAIIGFLAGAGAVVLKNVTHFIQELLEGKIIGEFHRAFYFVFPIIGLLLVVLFIKYIVKKKVGHGIPSTLFALSQQRGIMPRHQMWASLIAAPITVGFGGSVGLEGPTVATGAALGSNFARLSHLNQTTRMLMIGAASAGAMSAIFKAPIAGIVFAVEILSLDLTLASMIPLILASTTAILTTYFFMGDDVLLHFQLQDKFILKDVIFYIFLGVVSSVVSIYFSKMYFGLSGYFEKIGDSYKRLVLGGILIGVIVYLVPPLYGEGYEVINSLLKNGYAEVLKNNIFNITINHVLLIALFLVALVIFKVIAMTLTFGAGGIGGVFAPTLFTGSIAGYVFALLINYSDVFQHKLSTGNFALVGMAGLMAGVLQAPLMAIFLIAEITGGYELFVPLMIVASISFIITKKYIPHNIYAEELAKKGQLLTHDKDLTVLTLMRLESVVEKNFIKLGPSMTLRNILYQGVAKSTRNFFPVIDKDDKLIGIILLDDIREAMFNQKLYDTTTAKDYMSHPPDNIVYETDSMRDVMAKFQKSGAWNLPVIRKGKYYGFVSKSKMLTAYRRQLINFTQ